MKITNWRTSSYTTSGSGNCVEVGLAPGIVGVRDTKNRERGAFAVRRAAFATLINAIQSDQFTR